MSGPERIWLHVNELDAYLNEGDGDPEYHHHTHTAAAVTAALQGAAAQADPWDGPVTKSNIVNAQSIAAQQIRARILAQITPDGLAALEAVKAQARAEAEAHAEKAEAERDAARADLAEAVGYLKGAVHDLGIQRGRKPTDEGEKLLAFIAKQEGKP